MLIRSVNCGTPFDVVAAAMLFLTLVPAMNNISFIEW
jgi:hypothetical protein